MLCCVFYMWVWSTAVPGTAFCDACGKFCRSQTQHIKKMHSCDFVQVHPESVQFVFSFYSFSPKVSLGGSCFTVYSFRTNLTPTIRGWYKKEIWYSREQSGLHVISAFCYHPQFVQCRKTSSFTVTVFTKWLFQNIANCILETQITRHRTCSVDFMWRLGNHRETGPIEHAVPRVVAGSLP